jgi:uncharacterized protein (TIGR03437 family)
MTYTPGQAQTFTITVTDPSATVFGFELTARMDTNPANAQAGSFTAGSGQRIVCADDQPMPAAGCGGNGIQWIEHSEPSLTGVFSVRWAPPATASGPVHLYVSANGGNGDNSSRGDHIYSAEYVLLPASTATAGVPTIRSIGGAAGGGQGIQAGSWITITGANFGASRTTWDNAVVNNVFPTTLGGVTVLIDGKPAPISFVSDTQINALAPNDYSLGPVSVVVANAVGASAPAAAEIVGAAPAFFTFDEKYIAGVVFDGPGAFQYLAPSGSISGAQSRAAKAGDTILLYGNAWGRTQTQLSTAMAANVAYPLAHTGADIRAPAATLTIGGQPAAISFIGLVSPGVYQVNAVVPQVPAGDQAVVLNLLLGPAATSQKVFIPVQ